MTLDSRSGCPIATTLDVVGDKWSLVIIRDMINGKKRYQQFVESPEGIPTNILSDRLKKMERFGLVRREPYQRNPLRHDYLLTPRGESLLPILQSMCRWANQHYPDTWTPPASFMKPRGSAPKTPRGRKSDR